MSSSPFPHSSHAFHIPKDGEPPSFMIWFSITRRNDIRNNSLSKKPPKHWYDSMASLIVMIINVMMPEFSCFFLSSMMMLFRASIHFYIMNEKDFAVCEVCQCSFELQFISTELKHAIARFIKTVSMLFRASIHFYWRKSRTLSPKLPCVNALSSFNSFLPRSSETLDLQGFLRPVLQIFVRIFW